MRTLLRMAAGERLNEKRPVGIAVQIHARDAQARQHRRQVVGREPGAEEIRRPSQLQRRSAATSRSSMTGARCSAGQSMAAGRTRAAVVDQQQVSGRQQRRVERSVQARANRSTDIRDRLRPRRSCRSRAGAHRSAAATRPRSRSFPEPGRPDRAAGAACRSSTRRPANSGFRCSGRRRVARPRETARLRRPAAPRLATERRRVRACRQHAAHARGPRAATQER